MEMSLTFVSAFFLIGEPKRGVDTYKTAFEAMVATGIPIVLYLDTRLDWTFSENVRIIRTSFADTWIDRTVPDTAQLPAYAERYDTLPYLKIQHSKTEWMVRAIKTNPFGTEWFAWVDFALPHVFQEPNTVLKLQTLTPPSQPALITPGIWTFSLEGNWDRVQWRFAGGFMMGHSSKFQDLHDAMKQLVLDTLPILSWEVNYWAMLERRGIDFGWFKADHNDSMLTAVPTHCVQDHVGHLPAHSQ